MLDGPTFVLGLHCVSCKEQIYLHDLYDRVGLLSSWDLWSSLNIQEQICPEPTLTNYTCPNITVNSLDLYGENDRLEQS